MDLAADMMENLSLSVIDVIQSDSWNGGPLIRLKDAISRPSSEELANNAMWLLPMVKHSPTKAIPLPVSQTTISHLLKNVVGHVLFNLEFEDGPSINLTFPIPIPCAIRLLPC